MKKYTKILFMATAVALLLSLPILCYSEGEYNDSGNYDYNFDDFSNGSPMPTDVLLQDFSTPVNDFVPMESGIGAVNMAPSPTIYNSAIPPQTYGIDVGIQNIPSIETQPLTLSGTTLPEPASFSTATMTLATPPDSYYMFPKGNDRLPANYNNDMLTLKEELLDNLPVANLGSGSFVSSGTIAIPERLEAVNSLNLPGRFDFESNNNTGVLDYQHITVNGDIMITGWGYERNNLDLDELKGGNDFHAPRLKTEGRVASMAELDALQPDQIIMNGRIVNMPDTTPLSSPLTLDLTGRGAEIGTIQETFNVTGTMGTDAAAAIEKPGTQGLFPKGSLEMNDYTLVPMDQEVIKQHLGQMSTSGTESSAFSKMPAGFTVGQVAKTDLDLGPGNDVIKLGEQVNGTTATQTSALPPPVIVDAFKPAPPVDANGKYIESKSPAAPQILDTQWSSLRDAEIYEEAYGQAGSATTTTPPTQVTVKPLAEIASRGGSAAAISAVYSTVTTEEIPTAVVTGNQVSLIGKQGDNPRSDLGLIKPGVTRDTYTRTWSELQKADLLQFADTIEYPSVSKSGYVTFTVRDTNEQKTMKATDAVEQGYMHIIADGTEYKIGNNPPTYTSNIVNSGSSTPAPAPVIVPETAAAKTITAVPPITAVKTVSSAPSYTSNIASSNPEPSGVVSVRGNRVTFEGEISREDPANRNYVIMSWNELQDKGYLQSNSQSGLQNLKVDNKGNASYTLDGNTYNNIPVSDLVKSGKVTINYKDQNWNIK